MLWTKCLCPPKIYILKLGTLNLVYVVINGTVHKNSAEKAGEHVFKYLIFPSCVVIDLFFFNSLISI